MKSLLKKQGDQQRGIAMLLLVSVMGTAALGLFFSYYFITSSVQQARQSHNVRVLGQAKAALLGYVVTGNSDDMSANTFIQRRIFGRLPCPNRDGTGVALGGCEPASDIAMGLLPWSTLGIGTARDFEGVCLWYGVVPSHKMRANLTDVNVLNADSTGGFTVVDGAGNIVANDVVAVVIAAGAAQSSYQTRATANNPCGIEGANTYAVAKQFLDKQTGTARDNAGGAQIGQTAATFVTGQSLEGVNDQLVWITRAEYNQAAGQAAAQAMLIRLEAGNFPPPAVTPGGMCAPVGLTSGFVPTQCTLSDGTVWFLEEGYNATLPADPSRNGLRENQWPMLAHYATNSATNALQIDGVNRNAIVLLRGRIQATQSCPAVSSTLTQFAACIEGPLNSASDYVNRDLLINPPSSGIARNYRTPQYGAPAGKTADAAAGVLNDDILKGR
jgi:hypothetical protein